jgi:hypothetical protein
MPPRLLQLDAFPSGVSWVLDEPMQRTSHAIADNGRVWLIDPIDVPEALERALALGEPAAVVQLLDRHNRDCEALARQYGVPHLRLPSTVPASPFDVLRVVDMPKWREVALWWPQEKMLVVSEAVGTGPMFRGDEAPAGIHLFLRPRPPGVLKKLEPEHLLVGHGPPIHGPEATEALRIAYQRSLRDLPATLLRIPKAFRG